MLLLHLPRACSALQFPRKGETQSPLQIPVHCKLNPDEAGSHLNTLAEGTSGSCASAD